jgi:hypothetical protein
MDQRELRATFDKRHGDSVQVPGWLLYEDGAQRELNPLGAYVEPSDDPYQRALAVLKYWQIKLRLAVDRFHDEKAMLRGHVNSIMQDRFPPAPPSKEKIKELKVMRDECKRLQKCVEDAEQALEKAKPDSMKASEQRAAENHLAAQDFMAELGKVEI